jgi:acylphosphatase
MADGRVEVLACGETAAVLELCDWLWKGSPTSHVTSIEVEELGAGALPERPGTFRTG